MADENIVDLQKVVFDHLNSIDSDIPWKKGKVNWTLDRKFFHVMHESAQHEAASTAKSTRMSTVLFRSTYSNTTDNDMEYSIDQSRNTRSTVSCTITKGLQIGGSFELEVAPPSIGSIKLGVSSQITFDRSTSESREEEVTWNFQTKVHVPSHKRVTAELSVTEEHREGSFSLRTFFSGHLVVDWQYKKKHGQAELTDLHDLLIGTKKKKFLGFEKDANGRIFFETKGVCICHYGLEQDVIIREAEYVEDAEKQNTPDHKH